MRDVAVAFVESGLLRSRSAPELLELQKKLGPLPGPEVGSTQGQRRPSYTDLISDRIWPHISSGAFRSAAFCTIFWLEASVVQWGRATGRARKAARLCRARAISSFAAPWLKASEPLNQGSRAASSTTTPPSMPSGLWRRAHLRKLPGPPFSTALLAKRAVPASRPLRHSKAGLQVSKS